MRESAGPSATSCPPVVARDVMSSGDKGPDAGGVPGRGKATSAVRCREQGAAPASAGAVRSSAPGAPRPARPGRARPRRRGPVDLRLRDGVVQEVGPELRPGPDEQVLDADGRWLVPGLWDAHVHLQTWARAAVRLDLSGTSSAEQVVRRVAEHVAGPGRRRQPGARLRAAHGDLAAPPTVAELDAVSGGRAVVLVSGDGHAGWLSSRALERLGLAPRTGPVEEAEWFEAFARLGELGPEAGADDRARAGRAGGRRGARRRRRDRRGVGARPVRVAGARPAGTDLLRVRTATYADGLDAVLAGGAAHRDAARGHRRARRPWVRSR